MRHRSFLFTPATRLDRLGKARASRADWVVMDLEDGVGPEDKTVARKAVYDHLRMLQPEEKVGLALRVNSLSTAEGIRDLNALLDLMQWPEMLVLPKVESEKEIHQIRSVALACGQTPALLVVLETAQGIEKAVEILRNCGSGTVVGYGSADHTAETGGTMNAVSLAWARGRIINACAFTGVPAVDGVFLKLRDQDGLRAEANLVKEMGFVGKIAIHPDQIALINRTFTPSQEEFERARAMIAMSEQAGAGAFSFNGKMVDSPVLAQAHRTVSAFEEDI